MLTRAEVEEAARGSGEVAVTTLLIVDDEESVRNALRRALRKEPFRLLFAGDGEEALRVLAAEKVDVVVSDHLMPRMTGLELLKAVRAQHPDSLRLILTGHADTETAIAAINDGQIYRFLTKPWDDAELKVTLRLAVEHLHLERENRRLLDIVRRQVKLLKQLDQLHPGISEVVRDAEGAILISDEEAQSLIASQMPSRRP